jgi:hypothetical protein
VRATLPLLVSMSTKSIGQERIFFSMILLLFLLIIGIKGACRPGDYIKRQ